MSSKKITDLTPIPTLTNSDILYIVDVSNSIYGESNKITYGDLAGNRLDSLQLDLTVLSGNNLNLQTDLDNLTTFVELTASNLQGQIDALIIDVGDNSDLIVLSNKIDTVSGDVTSLSSQFVIFEDNTDIGNLVTDVLELSGQVQTISANQDEIIYTDMAWLCANIDINKSYVEQVSSTPSTTSTLTATHYVNVDLGGTTYKMLLAVEL
jgi:hypothetical protein